MSMPRSQYLLATLLALLASLGLAAEGLDPWRGWVVWSFDHASFERFVDIVEQHPDFADLVIQRPVATDIYWEDA